MVGFPNSGVIALTQSQRYNILSLKTITELSERTQERLTTGRKINGVTDEPYDYFRAKNLSDRSADFQARKAEVDQGISTLTTALDGMNSIEDLLKQMKGLASATQGQSQLERAKATEQFIEIGTQISRIVDDASYHGTNMLTRVNAYLEVSFSDRTTSRMRVDGFDFNSTTAENGWQNAAEKRGLFTTVAYNSVGAMTDFSTMMGVAGDVAFTTGTVRASGFSVIGDNNSGIAFAQQAVSFIERSIDRVRAASNQLASYVNILKVRLDYSNKYSDELMIGSDKLTLADQNEEGANMVALQTRYQIGIESLSVSGDYQRQLLRLIQG